MKVCDSSPNLRRRRAGDRAFTLLEVILAISIATGLLIVALVFYRQASELRNQILKESERLASVRLVLDRLAGDLRSARVGRVAGQEFRGGPGELSLVTATVVMPGPGMVPGTVVGGVDEVRVHWTTVFPREGTSQGVRGVLRREERVRVGPVATMATGADPNSELEVGAGPVVLRPFEEPVAGTNAPVAPTTEAVRFMRFRYWDGVGWQTGWTNSAPPRGVEIVLGSEPQLEEMSTDGVVEEYPFEQFRRVVFVPAGETLSPPPASLLGAPTSP